MAYSLRILALNVSGFHRQEGFGFSQLASSWTSSALSSVQTNGRRPASSSLPSRMASQSAMSESSTPSRTSPIEVM